MNLTENLSAENKRTQIGDVNWTWDIVRSAAALYNSGGGILRIGLDDNGNPVVPITNPEDYSADKSKLVTLLEKYLQPMPRFKSRLVDQYIEVEFQGGVTFPSILKEPIEKKSPRETDAEKTNEKSYEVGTVLIRRMNGNQPSSESPRTMYEWQEHLNKWERNRGVVLQSPLLAQFSMLINMWDPFNRENTKHTHWQAYCIADAAAMLGRATLERDLKLIISKIVLSTEPAPIGESERNHAGAAYKQTVCREVSALCDRLFGTVPLSESVLC